MSRREEVASLISNISFLEEVKIKELQLNIFNAFIKEYVVRGSENITFRISADYDGNWMAGYWYFDEKRISTPDELFSHLPKEYVKELMFNIDVFEKISSWRGKRYIAT